MNVSILVSLALLMFAIIFISQGIIIVRQSEVIIVERLGRYHRTLVSGLNFIIPIIDSKREVAWKYIISYNNRENVHITKNIYRLDLRETVYDFPKQNVITSDNVTIEINALLYFQITDPKKAVYEITYLPEAIEKLTQTTLRNVIGELTLDQTFVSRDTINSKLTLILDEATDKWGVKVNRVEIQDIVPPHEIREAMEKQMKAERQKRASILNAEGEKQSQILRAEGQRDAYIKEAEGIAQHKLKVAEAEAQALIEIHNATKSSNKDSINYLIALKYIESFKDIANGQNNKVVFMPFESSSLLSSLASIKELFEKDK